MNLPLISKRLVATLGIVTNLIIGNSFFIIGTGYESANTMLMLILSLVSTACYLLIYRFVNFKKRKIYQLFVLSVLTCLFIILVGCIMASVVTGLQMNTEEYTAINLLSDLGIGFVLGLIGNARMLPISLGMAVVSLFWFYWYKKVVTAEEI